MGDCLLERQATQRLIARLAPPFNGEVVQPGLGEMMGDDFGLSCGALRLTAQEFGGSEVQRLAAALEQAVVGGVLDQRVLETVSRLRSMALDEQNVGLGKPLQCRLQRAFVEAGHGLEQCIRESPAQHGSDLSGLARGAEPFEPCGERLLQGRRDRLRAALFAALQLEARNLLDEERDAAGPLAEPFEPGAVAAAHLGDVFELGPHRIICGSASEFETLRLLMQGDGPARVVLTDEPYNVPIAGHVTGGRHREFAMASGEMTDAEFLAFNEAWMAAVLPCLCDGGVFGTFIDWRGYPTVHSAAVKLGLKPLNLVVWTKTNAGMGSLYRSQHELLPLFKNGSAQHVNNIELGKRGRWRSNVWTYPGASSLGYARAASRTTRPPSQARCSKTHCWT